MKNHGIRYHCVFALVAACVANSVSAQTMQRYLHCVKVAGETKQVYFSSVWRDDGADMDTGIAAARAFDKFVISKYHAGDDGFVSAMCSQDTSASVAKSQDDKFTSSYVAKGYTVVNTSWTYAK